MKPVHVLLACAVAVGLRSQVEAPRVTSLCRINHGLGGVLEFSDGARREFHIEVATLQGRVMDCRVPDDARVLAIGSAEEKTILAGLDAWAKTTFSAEEERELLALVRLPDPRNEEEDQASQRAQLVRTLRRYAEVTRPAVTKVFPGRGTVTLSLQLKLGESAPQQVLWRRLGQDAFARLHLDTEIEPVAIDGGTERRLLLGLAHWLAERLGSSEQLWKSEHENLDRDVRLVLEAFKGYLGATSPRLRSGGTIMDAGNTGSRVFYWTDAQNRMLSARFDYASGTATPGRIREGGDRKDAVVEIGSARENELLDTLQRAAALRRRSLGDNADDDYALRQLEHELDTYRTRFRPAGQGK